MINSILYHKMCFHFIIFCDAANRPVCKTRLLEWVMTMEVTKYCLSIVHSSSPSLKLDQLTVDQLQWGHYFLFLEVITFRCYSL